MGASARTGAWGVLIVQTQLLDLGVDSSQMTTDSGIDLLAYDPRSKKSFSIQVKTRAGVPNERRPDWKIRTDKVGEADLYAFVLKTEPTDVWYLSKKELKKYLKLQNRECALTFYREAAPRGALTQSQMTCYSKMKGLARFLLGLRGK